MKFFISGILIICLSYVSGEIECPDNGWTAAETICFRLVHHPLSFHAAKQSCKTFNGQLLLVAHVPEVAKVLGDTMVGNAEDYRIDGWADGVWYHKENETLTHENYEFLESLRHATLTLNLEDFRILGNRDTRTQLGYICEGNPEVLAGNAAAAACDKSGESDLEIVEEEIGDQAEISERELNENVRNINPRFQ